MQLATVTASDVSLLSSRGWMHLVFFYAIDDHAYLLTSSGLNMNPVVSNVGPSYYHTLGYLKASPDGSKIAAANSRFVGVSAANVTSDVNLFDFDNSSGVLSNPMTFDF